MRYNELKNSLLEAENNKVNQGLEAQHALHDLEAIKKGIPDIPSDKFEEKIKLIDQLKQVSRSLDNFIKKVKGGQFQTQPATQPATQPTTEAQDDVAQKLKTISQSEIERADREAEIVISKVQDQIKYITSLDIDEEIKNNLLKAQNEILDGITKSNETLIAQRNAFKSERDEAAKFIKDVTGILTLLGNKVQGYREIEDLSDLSSKERSAYNKMASNAQKFTKTLKQALFGKIMDMQEGSDVTPEEIKDFLQACADGKVINMLELVQQSKGNVKNHVNTEYQKVFDVFVKENIFSYSPGTTSGAIGPGEMALSMMGNPAEKGKKGDLKVGDEEIEIKASAKTGGRFNSKSIAKATTGWQVWSAKIKEIMQSAPKGASVPVRQKNGEFKKVPAQEFDGNQFNVIKGKAKEGSKYNWNSTGLEALNNEVLEPYANKKQTFDLFVSTIRSLVQNYDALSKPAKNDDGTPNTHHKPFKPAELIMSAIENDGQINIPEMNAAYSKIAYASYHLADKITTVMLLRTDTLDFVIFRDADDLVDQFKSGKITTGGGFNWNDDQQTPTPGFIPPKA